MKKKNATSRFLYINKSKSPDNRIVRIKTENSGWGVLKTAIIALLIALQLALIIYFQISFSITFEWFMTLSFITSIFTCIYVLSSKKNGLSKAVWIIFILLGFMFGYVIYWLSDERIFFRKSKKRYERVFTKAKTYAAEKNKVDVKSLAVRGDCEYLYTAGGFNAHANNKIKYFPTGSQVFDDIIECIKSAKKFIFIEFFIVSDGALLKRFIDILSHKAREGVDVRLIYDDMGSHKTFSRKSKKKLIEAGVKIKSFNKLLPIFAVIMNYRDHRKIVVVDGKTAYTGGINLADEYVNEKRMYGYWKDNGVRVDGSAVDEFSIMFLRQWEFLGKPFEDYSAFLNQFDNYSNLAVVVPYADGLDYEQSIGKSVYENLISAAKQKIYIMTPYFIVDDTISSLLTNKALSGVDVRLVLPDVPDKAFVYGVSRWNAEKLIGCGVKVYTMNNAFVHTKMVLTENALATGSVNMDLRSFYQQFECAIYTDDKSALLDAEKDFNDTLSLSTLITDNNKRLKNPFYRAVAGFMQLFAPFM